MRTTVTLDPDTEQLVRSRMRERGIGFKEALNELIRSGTGGHQGERADFRTVTASMGPARIDLDRALQIADQMDNDQIVGKMRRSS